MPPRHEGVAPVDAPLASEFSALGPATRAFVDNPPSKPLGFQGGSSGMDERQMRQQGQGLRRSQAAAEVPEPMPYGALYDSNDQPLALSVPLAAAAATTTTAVAAGEPLRTARTPPRTSAPANTPRSARNPVVPRAAYKGRSPAAASAAAGPSTGAAASPGSAAAAAVARASPTRRSTSRARGPPGGGGASHPAGPASVGSGGVAASGAPSSVGPLGARPVSGSNRYRVNLLEVLKSQQQQSQQRPNGQVMALHEGLTAAGMDAGLGAGHGFAPNAAVGSGPLSARSRSGAAAGGTSAAATQPVNLRDLPPGALQRIDQLQQQQHVSSVVIGGSVVGAAAPVSAWLASPELSLPDAADVIEEDEDVFMATAVATAPDGNSVAAAAAASSNSFVPWVGTAVENAGLDLGAKLRRTVSGGGVWSAGSTGAAADSLASPRMEAEEARELAAAAGAYRQVTAAAPSYPCRPDELPQRRSRQYPAALSASVDLGAIALHSSGGASAPPPPPPAMTQQQLERTAVGVDAYAGGAASMPPTQRRGFVTAAPPLAAPRRDPTEPAMAAPLPPHHQPSPQSRPLPYHAGNSDAHSHSVAAPPRGPVAGAASVGAADESAASSALVRQLVMLVQSQAAQIQNLQGSVAALTAAAAAGKASAVECVTAEDKQRHGGSGEAACQQRCHADGTPHDSVASMRRELLPVGGSGSSATATSAGAAAGTDPDEDPDDGDDGTEERRLTLSSSGGGGGGVGARAGVPQPPARHHVGGRLYSVGGDSSIGGGVGAPSMGTAAEVLELRQQVLTLTQAVTSMQQQHRQLTQQLHSHTEWAHAAQRRHRQACSEQLESATAAAAAAAAGGSGGDNTTQHIQEQRLLDNQSLRAEVRALRESVAQCETSHQALATQHAGAMEELRQRCRQQQEQQQQQAALHQRVLGEHRTLLQEHHALLAALAAGAAEAGAWRQQAEQQTAAMQLQLQQQLPQEAGGQADRDRQQQQQQLELHVEGLTREVLAQSHELRRHQDSSRSALDQLAAGMEHVAACLMAALLPPQQQNAAAAGTAVAGSGSDPDVAAGGLDGGAALSHVAAAIASAGSPLSCGGSPRGSVGVTARGAAGHTAAAAAAASDVPQDVRRQLRALQREMRGMRATMAAQAMVAAAAAGMTGGSSGGGSHNGGGKGQRRGGHVQLRAAMQQRQLRASGVQRNGGEGAAALRGGSGATAEGQQGQQALWPRLRQLRNDVSELRSGDALMLEAQEALVDLVADMRTELDELRRAVRESCTTGVAGGEGGGSGSGGDAALLALPAPHLEEDTALQQPRMYNVEWQAEACTELAGFADVLEPGQQQELLALLEEVQQQQQRQQRELQEVSEDAAAAVEAAAAPPHGDAACGGGNGQVSARRASVGSAQDHRCQSHAPRAPASLHLMPPPGASPRMAGPSAPEARSAASGPPDPARPDRPLSRRAQMSRLKAK